MKKALLFIFTILILSFLLFICGCIESVDSSSITYEIEGYWISGYGDGFEIIDSDPFIFKQYDDASKNLSFEGEIVNALTDTDSGYITILITDAGSWGKTVGEYYRIHYKELLGDAIKESSAYKAGGQSTCTTQSAADTEFTIANGYYGFYGDYVRQ